MFSWQPAREQTSSRWDPRGGLCQAAEEFQDRTCDGEGACWLEIRKTHPGNHDTPSEPGGKGRGGEGGWREGEQMYHQEQKEEEKEGEGGQRKERKVLGCYKEESILA